MFELSDIMKYIVKYGNIRLYISGQDNPYCNQVIQISYDIFNQLSVDQSFVLYDVPFWDGLKVNDSANILGEEHMPIINSPEGIKTTLALSVLSLFFSRNSYRTYEKKKQPLNYKVCYELFNNIINMLDLPNSFLIKLKNMSLTDSLNFIVNLSNKENNVPFSPDMAYKIIEKKCIDLVCRYQDIDLLVMQTQSPLENKDREKLEYILDKISTDDSTDQVKIKKYIKQGDEKH